MKAKISKDNTEVIISYRLEKVEKDIVALELKMDKLVEGDEVTA